MKALKLFTKVGTGAGVVNSAYEYGQNKYHLNSGTITPEEFRWRTFTSMSSNLPCPFVKAAISSEDIYNRVQSEELSVTDIMCAISAQAPVDIAGLVKAGSNLGYVADYMLESHNVLNTTESLTGREIEARFEGLHNKLAGSAGPSRKFAARD
jgi:hypothetical protein